MFRGWFAGVLCLAAAVGPIAGDPAHANGQRRPAFQELMDDSTLVVIGRVTTVQPGLAGGSGWATVAVVQALKGEWRPMVSVQTAGMIMELNPRCCEEGATYIMFLHPAPSMGEGFMSVRGAYGIVWLGAGSPGTNPALLR